MIVQALIPSLYPNLLDRMIASARPHGAPGVELRFLVVGKYKPEGTDIDFIEETEKPQGVYAASRLAIPAMRRDAVLHLTCDDVVYKPGWLVSAMERLRASDDKTIVGVRHGGGIGTVYGRMYANFALVRLRAILTPEFEEDFMPRYLRGQWGDAALALAMWREGGRVIDGGAGPDGLPVIQFADRMGNPEASTKTDQFDADMAAIQKRFAHFAKGWPRFFRGFNIDMPRAALDENGTICDPNFRSFVAHRAALFTRSHMVIPE